jgi:hypothetical protein
MKKLLFPVLMFVLLISFSCEKTSDKKYAVSGKAQKGPYIVGTVITINELNKDLGQTGKSFTSSINSDDGSFSLDNVELSQGYALLTADGFYFNEIEGNVTSSKLTLQAIVDLSNQSTVNINVLTHLVKGRIEKLVQGGKSYTEASEQAHQELLDFMGVDDSVNKHFTDLDISQADELNGVLLAFSAIVQVGNNVNGLTELLTNLSNDFRNHGTISNNTLKQRLVDNAHKINFIDLRNTILDRYAQLGMSVTLPDFEHYVGTFIEKHCDTLYSSFQYPEEINTAHLPDINFPGLIYPNLLYKTQTNYQIDPGAGNLLMAGGTVPVHASLSIKFIGPDIGTRVKSGIPPSSLGPFFGWYLEEEQPNAFTYKTQRYNSLLFFPASIDLEKDPNGVSYPYTFTIEYYENDDTTPSFTKTVTIDT